jgi:single-stranded-DNA-specific exonuclease
MQTDSQTLIDILLEKRGITDKEAQDIFLNPSYDRHTHDPFLLPGMERSVVRIFEAIEAKERIAVYSDYDCDGIPGAVIFHDFFQKIGYDNVEFYIPDRHEEGYGLHQPAIDILVQHNVNLIITVDLGITAVDEVAYATTHGIDVIITDHHVPQEILPHAYAIVNPKLPTIHTDGTKTYYPDQMLCGAGVAYKCVCAFLSKYGEYFSVPLGWERWLLDMVAIGTLSDMVPLVHENRVLASAGLQVLRRNGRVGLQELWKLAGVNPMTLHEEDVTFTLAPRLNAASRMDTPHKAFDLLRTRSVEDARVYAKELSRINDTRKKLVTDSMRTVHKTLESRTLGPVIVVGNPMWHVGVLGLIASKIMDTHKCPVFVWGGNEDDEEITNGTKGFKGSCRAQIGDNVVALMTALPSEMLLKFGGHELAGGFTVARDQVHFLETHLTALYEKKETTEDMEVIQHSGYDAVLSLGDVTLRLYKTLTAFSPCGVGNPVPTFLFSGVVPTKVARFGKEKNHLEIAFDVDGRILRAIAFFKTEKSFDTLLEAGVPINLIARIESSTFMYKTELRLRIVDIVK